MYKLTSGHYIFNIVMGFILGLRVSFIFENCIMGYVIKAIIVIEVMQIYIDNWIFHNLIFQYMYNIVDRPMFCIGF